MSKEHGRKRNFPDIKRLIATSASLALIFSALRYAFSEGQKDQERAKDRYTCQMPGCGANIGTMHVHHVTPQRFSRNQVMVADLAINGVSLCSDHHLGYDAKRIGPITDEEFEEWDPIHLDNIVALFYYRGDLAKLDPRIIARDRECYDFFVKRSKQFPGALAKKDAFGHALKAWRNSRLDKMKIYWNDKYDGILQAAAIRNSLEARKSGWEFPLRKVSFSKKSNRAGYIWENMASLLTEKYVQKLSSRSLKKLYSDLETGRMPSRKVYFNKIYKPAVVKKYQKKHDMPNIINIYLNSLSEEKYKYVIKNCNTGSRDRILRFMIQDIYNPAFRLLKRVNSGRRR